MIWKVVVFLLILSAAVAPIPPGHGEPARLSGTPAASGEAASQLALGLRYIYGNGVERDHGRALMWFYVAASSSPEAARNYIGLMEPHMSPRQISNAHELADYCIDSGFGEHECNLHAGGK